MKKATHHHSMINGKPVRGIGHLQPGPNPWIGIFIVPEDLLEGEPEQWKSAVIHYAGLFDCRSENINGRGKAKIIYVGASKDKRHLIVNAEGIGKPELEKELKEEIRFSYNSNLCIDQKASYKHKLLKNK